MMSKPKREILIALSLANLCFTKLWAILLNPYNYYFIKSPLLMNVSVLILNVLFLALLFYLGLSWARRSKSDHALKVARWSFLLVLIIPLNVTRQQFLTELNIGNLLLWFGETGLVVLGLGLGLLVIFAVSRLQRQIVTATAAVVFILFPFALMNFFRGAWVALRYEGTFTDRASAKRLTLGDGSAPRLLWLLFDGLDYRLTLSQRPSAVRLPEIDLLRGQGLSARNAYPPAAGTLTSIASLITGELISHARPVRSDELMIRFKGESEAMRWSAQPDLFSRAREAGFNAGLVGWYHPYCRIFGSSLTTCSWEDLFGTVSGKSEFVLAKIMWSQLSSLGPWRPRQQHVERYLRILEEAKRVATDPGLGLSLVHFPVPHVPYIYDRKRNKFTLENYSISGYLDNLALADRALGEIRSAMQATGLWKKTTILLTSDHWWVDSAKFDGAVDHRIPFILRLPGRKDAVVYEPPFNTVLAPHLILEVLRGRLTTQESVVRWLDHHRSIGKVT